MHDIRWTVGRHIVGGIWCYLGNSLVSSPWTDITRKGFGQHPQCVYPLSTRCHTRDQISPFIFGYCKSGGDEDLRMRQRAAVFPHFWYTASDQYWRRRQSWNKNLPWGKTVTGAVSVPFWSSQLTAKRVKLYCNSSWTWYSCVLTLEPTHRELSDGHSGLLLMQYWSMLSSLGGSVQDSVSCVVLPVPSVSAQEEEGAGGVAVEWRMGGYKRGLRGKHVPWQWQNSRRQYSMPNSLQLQAEQQTASLGPCIHMQILRPGVERGH